MADNRGGRRPGAGRKKGSKNKVTIAREAIGEVLDVDVGMSLDGAVHKRGHQLLAELERIALDPTQPIAARIVAARTALPFLLPKREQGAGAMGPNPDDLVQLMHERREQVLEMRTALGRSQV